MCSPSRPVQFDPSPCRPRSALCSGLKRKCTSVLCRSLDSITTSPPRPPSPPEGPPRGTNFSRRKAMQPLPPSPAFTRILASSINIAVSPVYRSAFARLMVRLADPRSFRGREGSKSLHAQSWQLLAIALRQQLMSGGRDGNGFVVGRNELQGIFHFGQRAESITGAVHKE